MYGWGSRKILAELGKGKNWTKGGIQHIIEKIDQDGDIARASGSGRPKSARTEENIEGVQEETFSQEDPTTGEMKKHLGIPKIAPKARDQPGFCETNHLL